MRGLIKTIIPVAILLLAVGKLSATDVGGPILTDTTWTAAGNPYIVTSGIIIGNGATLTIEPDVVVKFNPTFSIVVGYATFGEGTVVARGTTESPIIFTSNTDPTPGKWSRIHFTDYAMDAVYDANANYLSGSILEHVIVKYAGYGNYGAIFAEKSSPFLNYCEVCHNLYYGIQVDGTNAPSTRITNCELWDNAKTGISINSGIAHRLFNNNIHDNRNGGIVINSAPNNTLTENTISNNIGDSGIYFDSSGSNTLTENTISGNSVGGGGIHFYYSGSNILTRNTVSGNSTGDGGIHFYYSASNTLTGNTVSGNSAGGGIHFHTSSSNILMGNTISGNSASGGIRFINSGGNTLTENTILDNTASNECGGGISFSVNSGGNTLTENTILNNTGSYGGGIGFYASSGSNILTANLVETNISGSGLGAVYLASGDTIFSQNTITYNYIETGTTGGIYVEDDSQGVSLAGNPDNDTYNIIWNNDGYQIYNNNRFRADGLNDINACYVQWGTSDILLIMEKIFDFFDDSTKAFIALYPIVIPGDFDVSGAVDTLDLGTLCDNWLREDCYIPDWCSGSDLDISSAVDFFDFAIFAEHWLEEG